MPHLERCYCRRPGHTLVARNVRLADMNIDAAVSDDRRIEVVANKLSSWQGAQQAVDATIITIVSPLSAPLRGRVMPGAVRRKRHQTHPELVRTRRCRFVVVGVEKFGGRFGAGGCHLAPAGRLGSVPWRRRCPCVWLHVPRGLLGGERCLRSPHSAPSPRPCWSSHSLASVTSLGRRPSCTRSSSTCAGSFRRRAAAKGLVSALA